MQQQNQSLEREVDLRDYIGVIIKRKKFVLGMFIAVVVATAVISLRIPRIYEITSTIQLGNVNEPLIKNEEAKAIMLNQNSLLTIINDLKLNIPLETLQGDIKISDIRDTNLLKVKITYSDVDTALKINDAIVNPLVAQGQNMYHDRAAIISGRLKELQSAIKNAEEDISRTQGLIMNIPSSDGITQAEISLRMIILQNTLPKYENNLTDLRNQRNELQVLLSNSKDFKVFEAPIRPKRPIWPKTKQNIIIAGIIGLLLGVFLAFALEYFQNSKGGKSK